VIYSDPINIFVAGFIGSPKMNMLTGGLESREGIGYFQAGESPISWQANHLVSTSTTGQATLGIRPEHIRLTRGETGAAAGTVTLVEPVGAVTYVDVQVGSTLFKVSTDPADNFLVGERVGMDFVPNRVLFFDTETGARQRSA